jgi:hypothetical protein
VKALLIGDSLAFSMGLRVAIDEEQAGGRGQPGVSASKNHERAQRVA